VLRDQRLELAAQLGVAAASEVGVDSLLNGRKPELFEPPDLTLRERFERKVRQRGPAPQSQRGAQRACPLLARKQPGLRQQPLESAEIRLLGRHGEQIARRLRQHALGAEGLAEVRDHVLQRGRRRPRRVLAPELVEQPVRGDDSPGVQRQQAQERTLLLSAEGHCA
jgi:hypothetical protein